MQNISLNSRPLQTFPGHYIAGPVNRAVEDSAPTNTHNRTQISSNNQIRYEPFYARTRRKLEHERDKKQTHKLNEEIRGLTALVSFPGSGNTWLRYLLQQSTGERRVTPRVINSLFRLFSHVTLAGVAN